MRIVFECIYRSITSHIKAFVAICACCVISFVLLDTLISRYYFEQRSVLNVKKILKCNPEKLYVIKNNSMDANNYNLTMAAEDFENELSKIKGVDCSGAYNYAEYYNKDLGNVKTLCMNPSLLKIVLGDFNDSNDKKLKGYIGQKVKDDSLKDVTEFQCEGATFDIVGTIPKGTYWFGNGISILGDTVSIDDYYIINDNIDRYIIDEDYYYMALTESMVYMKYLVLLEDNSDSEEVLKNIYDLALKEGLNIEIKSAKDIFDDEIKTIKKDNMPLSIRVIAMLILSAISVSSMCTINILLGRRNFGIMYCNGIRKSQIYMSCVLENILKIVISAIVAFCITGNLLYRRIYVRKELETLIYIRNNITIWWLILVYTIISILTNIIPMCILMRYKIVELIKGRD